VRVEVHVVDGTGMVAELAHQLAGAQVPNLEGLECKNWSHLASDVTVLFWKIDCQGR